ncbi:MAG: hypothetical protein WED04_07460 [Promethearchaeati archaeon SRVP18_Atabeyarchaeia-1]
MAPKPKKISSTGFSARYHLAVLDFAAKICTAKNPRHEECPVRASCDFYKIL